ncbi:FtsX-like permease family protein [bacterium RCC_150]
MKNAFARGLRQFRFDFARYGVAGVALTFGVALIFGTLLTSSNINAQLAKGVGTLTGIGDVALVPSIIGTTVPGDSVSKLKEIPGVAETIPTLARTSNIRSFESNGQEERLMLTGYPASLNANLELMNLGLRGRLPAANAPEVLVPADVAAHLGVDLDGDLVASTNQGATQLHVVGVFNGKNLGPLAYENIFVDLAFAQDVFAQPGQVTRVDIQLKPGYSPDRWQSEYASMFPSVFKVQDTSALTSALGPLVTVVSFVLMVASGMVLIISIVLSSTAFRLLVNARRLTYGVLRAVGAQGSWLAGAVFCEALTLALVCSIFGIGIGFGVSWILNQVLSSIGNIPPAPVSAEVWQIALAVTAGVVSSVAGASSAILKVLRQTPAATIATEHTGHRPRQIRRAGVGILLLGLACCSFLLHSALVKAGGFIVVLLASGLLAPALLRGIAKPWLFRRWTGKTSARRLHRHALLDSTAAVMAIVVCLGGALVVGVGSVRGAMMEQLGRQFGADIQISSTVPMTGKIEERLGSIQAVNRVSGTVWDYAAVSFGGASNQVTVLGIDPDSYFATAQLPWLQGSDDSTPKAMKTGGTIVLPEALATNLDISLGETVTVTRAGKEVSLRLVGTFASLATGNQAVMSQSEAAELGIVGSNGWNVEAKPGANKEALRDVVAGALADIPGISVLTAAKMKERSESELGSYAGAAFGIVVLALFLGAAGAASLLSVDVARREGEFGTFRTFGASRRDITRLVVSDAVLIAVAASVAGLLPGQMAGLLMSQIIGDALGVSLQATLDVGGFAAIVIITLAALWLAAIGPSRRAARIEPVTALRSE